MPIHTAKLRVCRPFSKPGPNNQIRRSVDVRTIYSFFNTLRGCCCLAENGDQEAQDVRRGISEPRVNYQAEVMPNELSGEALVENYDGRFDAGSLVSASDSAALSGRDRRRGEWVRQGLALVMQPDRDLPDAKYSHRRVRTEPTHKYLGNAQSEGAGRGIFGFDGLESKLGVNEEIGLISPERAKPISRKTTYDYNELVTALYAVPKGLFGKSIADRLVDLAKPDAKRAISGMEADEKIKLLTDVKNEIASLHETQVDSFIASPQRYCLYQGQWRVKAADGSNGPDDEDTALWKELDKALSVIDGAISVTKDQELPRLLRKKEFQLSKLEGLKLINQKRMEESEPDFAFHHVNQMKQREEEILLAYQCIENELHILQKKVSVKYLQLTEKQSEAQRICMENFQNKVDVMLTELGNEYITLTCREQDLETQELHESLDAAKLKNEKESIATRREEILTLIQAGEKLNLNCPALKVETTKEIKKLKKEILNFESRAYELKCKKSELMEEADKLNNELSRAQSQLRPDKTLESLILGPIESEIHTLKKSLESAYSLQT